MMNLRQFLISKIPDGYWPCDDASGTSLADASGKGHSLSLVAPYAIAQPALLRGGSRRSVRLNEGTANGPTAAGLYPGRHPMTFGVTISLHATANLYRRVASKESGANVGWTMLIESNADATRPGRVSFLRRNTNFTRATDPVALPVNTPTRYIATYDGDTIRLFRNGAMVHSNASAEELPDASSFIFALGRPSTSAQGLFDFSVADAFLIDYAMTADDVATDWLLATRSAPGLHTGGLTRGLTEPLSQPLTQPLA